jgi:protein-tyrosine phosphatase
MNRNDLHFHVLPGVDDGPADLAASLTLAADAVADGTSVVVATPHIRDGHVDNVFELPDRVAELQLALAREKIPLELRVGGELSHKMVGRLRQHELNTIAQGPPGARWLLLEAPFAGFDAGFHDAAQELRDRGFGVLIAHPERAGDRLNVLPALREEVLAGSSLQVNVWSIAGSHGEEARVMGVQLVRDGIATVVSSDAHADWRRPLISRAVLELEHAGVDRMMVRAVTGAGPRRLLEAGLRGGRAAVAVA